MLAAGCEPGLIAEAGRAGLDWVMSLIKKLPPPTWTTEHVSVCCAVCKAASGVFAIVPHSKYGIAAACCCVDSGEALSTLPFLSAWFGLQC